MGRPMKRREFIAAVGAAAAWPLAARAQRSAMPLIGYLGSTTASLDRPRLAAFLKRLGELGWVKDRTFAIELRWAEGRVERAREIAAEFVQLKVDIIVTAGVSDVLAAKQATTSIPIVVAAAGDLVDTGLVASFARPGGNVTGLTLEVIGTARKRVALLHDLIPTVRRLGIMGNVTNRSAAKELGEAQAAASTLGLETVVAELRSAQDIDPAIEGLKTRADAIYICADPLVTTNESRINELALNARLPTMHGLLENVAANGLMAYGVDIPDMYRRAAEIVDKVLHGAKPADIPIEQPTTFKFVINLKTAKALGLSVPYSMQLLADEVIE
jgi:putative tryptophan/tyrosine transport system substrate-binding protein